MAGTEERPVSPPAEEKLGEGDSRNVPDGRASHQTYTVSSSSLSSLLETREPGSFGSFGVRRHDVCSQCLSMRSRVRKNRFDRIISHQLTI